MSEDHRTPSKEIDRQWARRALAAEGRVAKLESILWGLSTTEAYKTDAGIRELIDRGIATDSVGREERARGVDDGVAQCDSATRKDGAEEPGVVSSQSGASPWEAELLPEGGRFHRLKTWPFPFEDVKAGRKPFEYRLHDRDFRVGDVLILEKWEPATGRYAGVNLHRRVTYLLPGGTFGVPAGYCIMGLESEQPRAGEARQCDSCETRPASSWCNGCIIEDHQAAEISRPDKATTPILEAVRDALGAYDCGRPMTDVIEKLREIANRPETATPGASGNAEGSEKR